MTHSLDTPVLPVGCDDPNKRHIHWLRDAETRLFAHEFGTGFLRWWLYRLQFWRFTHWRTILIEKEMEPKIPIATKRFSLMIKFFRKRIGYSMDGYFGFGWRGGKRPYFCVNGFHYGIYFILGKYTDRLDEHY